MVTGNLSLEFQTIVQREQKTSGMSKLNLYERWDGDVMQMVVRGGGINKFGLILYNKLENDRNSHLYKKGLISIG